MSVSGGSLVVVYGPQGFGNIKGADQPAHPCSLIRGFVIPLLENIISEHATSEISVASLCS